MRAIRQFTCEPKKKVWPDYLDPPSPSRETTNFILGGAMKRCWLLYVYPLDCKNQQMFLWNCRRLKFVTTHLRQDELTSTVVNLRFFGGGSTVWQDYMMLYMYVGRVHGRISKMRRLHMNRLVLLLDSSISGWFVCLWVLYLTHLWKKSLLPDQKPHSMSILRRKPETRQPKEEKTCPIPDIELIFWKLKINIGKMNIII